MREYFTYGSVRGAGGNAGPYRDPGILPHKFAARTGPGLRDWASRRRSERSYSASISAMTSSETLKLAETFCTSS
jgi:hypothetical protein